MYKMQDNWEHYCMQRLSLPKIVFSLSRAKPNRTDCPRPTLTVPKYQPSSATQSQPPFRERDPRLVRHGRTGR